MSAQSEGNYAEALQNYYEAMRLEIDPYDRSYILYNIGLIHTSNGEHTKALEYYFRALERNPFLPQAFNNMAVICHPLRSSFGSKNLRSRTVREIFISYGSSLMCVMIKIHRIKKDCSILIINWTGLVFLQKNI